MTNRNTDKIRQRREKRNTKGWSLAKGYLEPQRPQICSMTTTARYTMELMTTKNGPTLKPGAASLYRRTEKAPAFPAWLPGVGPDDELRERPDADPVARLRRPAADGPVPLIFDCGLWGGDFWWNGMVANVWGNNRYKFVSSAVSVVVRVVKMLMWRVEGIWRGRRIGC